MVVVAAAGYGKTIALRSSLAGLDATWHPRADVPALAAGGLADLACRQGSGWLVLDDLPRLPAELARDLLATAHDLPEQIGVALSSRWPLAAPLARWRGRSDLVELGPRDLALSEEQVSELLAEKYGLREPARSAEVHQATAGWPALVRLAGEALADTVPDGPLVDFVAGPGTPLADYIAEEVLRPLPPEVVRLVCDAADFAPLTTGLCRGLGHRDAERMLALLLRLGVLQQAGAQIVPVVAAVARRVGGAGPTLAVRARVAADWYGEHGPPLAAARACQLAGDGDACARVLMAHGCEILASGGASGVVDLIRASRAGEHHTRVQLLLGEALVHSGDLVGGQQAYRMLAAAADAAGQAWDPGLAWRIGQVYHLRGEPRAALAALARGAARPGTATDEAMLSAWTASIHNVLGDAPAGLVHAARARRLAATGGDDRALSTAHMATALCLLRAGDPTGCEEHFAQALQCARRVGDATQVARVLANQAHTQLAQARYPAALETARLAVRSAETAGHVCRLIHAQLNEATALSRLGRHAESIERFEEILSRYQRMGSRRAALALVGLGDVHRVRGAVQQARGCYEEARRLAQPDGDWQALIPALAGLARLTASDDLDAAARLADEADRQAPPAMAIQVLLARGWVAVAQGDLEIAASSADRAAQLARVGHERALLAETLELRAAAVPDLDSRRAALVEAYEIWRTGHAMTEADRLLLALGRLPDAGTVDRLHATLAAERLSRSGLPPVVAHQTVLIRVLGRFEVYCDGLPVPASAWQSRKARDLLRILVARQGRPVPRAELTELLWPDDDPRTGHRLSVLLSIVRSVLNSGRSAAADRILVADQNCVALDHHHLRVDVDDFLTDVAHALRLRDQGAAAEARLILTAAERSYTGDAFEDEPYAEWCGRLREQARGAYLRAVRALAQLSRDAGEVEQTICHLLRLLDLDQYDEPAHRALVAVLVEDGRHGEARRAYQRYVDAMREIGVPEPDPMILRLMIHPGPGSHRPLSRRRK